MMLNAPALIVQCLLAMAGFASLCLATTRHAQQLTQGSSLRNSLRLIGWALLVAAAIVAIASEGWSLGMVTLFGALTLAAFVVVGLATYWPRGLVYLALFGFIGGVVTGVLAFVPAMS